MDHALQYLDFVQERHRVWQLRQAGAPQPWTDDPVLASRKFTNVFRVLDPGSQYVLQHLLDGEPEDVLLRCFLYRHTGSLPAWQHLLMDLGGPPDRSNLDDVRDSWHQYRAKGGKVFMRAYNVNPFSIVKGTDKLANILAFTHRNLVCGDMPKQFLAAPTWEAKFKALNAYTGVGKFMAMQVLTDYGYSTTFHENDYVVAGPGAQRGARYVFPDSKPEETIAWAYFAIGNLPNRPEVWGHHELSLLDVQNTFCEYSKYVRWQGKPYAGPPYQPLHPGPQTPPLKPRHW